MGRCDMHYPMWLMRIEDVLALERFLPYEEMHAADLLVRYDSSVHADASILFISHQWTSFANPDPDGKQLLTLQSFIERLRRGAVSNVSHMFADALVLGQLNLVLDGMDWARMVEGYGAWLWFDGSASGPLASTQCAIT
mmetsp:Transcript_48401/g.96445  ORF Transcript_48401/g.96445 Transcript_48401/m.96445 type:complete len:139 (-) Transcript_48401:349-765(-)